MRHFPVFLALRGRRVLVVGAGTAAERKIALLRQAGAEIVQSARFAPAALVGCALAVGAGAEETELVALSRAAQAVGVPVNVVDRPELCSCIMPAIVDRDPVTVAIGTGGTAPVLARMLRAWIEAAVPPEFGRLAALAERFQEQTRRRLPDLSARRRVLERLFSGRAAEFAFAGREDEASEEFSRALDGHAPAGGMVFFVGAGPGDADLLTLRGLRLLGEADVVVHDADAGTAVLDLARRDAERVAAGVDAPALLLRLAAERRLVVRLISGDVRQDGTEMAALEAAGMPFEVVPGVR